MTGSKFSILTCASVAIAAFALSSPLLAQDDDLFPSSRGSGSGSSSGTSSAKPANNSSSSSSASSSGSWSSGGGSAWIKLSIDYGFATDELTGTGTFDDSGVVGTTVDFVSDLNIKEEDSNRIGAALELGRFHLFGSYQDVKFSGINPNLTRTFTFGGQTFTAGSRVETDIDATYYSLGFVFDIFSADPADEGFFSWFGLGVGVVVHAYDFAFKIDATPPAPAARVIEEEDQMIPLPALAAAIHIYPTESISLDIDVHYFSYDVDLSGDKIDYSFMAVAGTLKYYVLQNIAVFGRVGYVDWDVDVDAGDAGQDRVDATMAMNHIIYGGGITIAF